MKFKRIKFTDFWHLLKINISIFFRPAPGIFPTSVDLCASSVALCVTKY